MLKGKTILLLGRTGGIGEVTLKTLEKFGAKVISTSRNFDDKMFLDCTKEQSFIDLAEKLKSDSIKIDGIVNCTGIHKSGPLVGMNESEIDEQLIINLKSNMWLLKYFLPQFISSRKGSIVLLGSVSAHRMTRGHAVYSATKAGLEGLIKSSASEVAKRNVRINGVLPGPVLTKMLKSSMEENGVDSKDLVPMGRLIEAEEVANGIAFLLSDLSSAITGSLIPVDGGYLLW